VAQQMLRAIKEIIDRVLGEVDAQPLDSLEQAYAADVEARALASRFISRLSPLASRPSPLFG
jgi:hypothetical protein